MARLGKTALLVLVAVTICGCAGGSSRKCVVTQYCGELLTYQGSTEDFNNACRDALQELGYSEKTGENSTSYPHHGEGVKTHSQDGKLVAAKAYMKTKDERGYEYTITTIKLAGKPHTVIIETTNPDQYKLINTLNTHLSKRGVEVRQYR